MRHWDQLDRHEQEVMAIVIAPGKPNGLLRRPGEFSGPYWDRLQSLCDCGDVVIFQASDGLTYVRANAPEDKPVSSLRDLGYGEFLS